MKPRKSIKLEDKDDFIRIALERYEDDLEDRREWADRRMQRYAKLFGWLEPKNYPWPNASNQHIPMLMTNSQRTQDTLHNAVMSSRPIMSAIAVNKGDSEKGKQIDELQDYQLFVEQTGEEKVGALIDSFVNDGRFVAFVPWVKDKRKARELHPAPPEEKGIDPTPSRLQVLQGLFPDMVIRPVEKDKFEVLTFDPIGEMETIKVEFFMDDEDRHYFEIIRDKIIYDGPCVIPKPLEDVIVPARCENLQPQSPSNPLGADHVIMIDWPSADEIHRLKKRGYYDLLSDEDMENITKQAESGVGNRLSDTAGTGSDPEQQKILMDSLAGQSFGNAESSSKTFTRLTYFGKWKLAGEEFEEEIVARIILGPNKNVKALARLRRLEEEYPRQDLTRPRPFACSPGFIPIPGQWFAMGLIELLEHMHDLTKIIMDQMIDKHTLSNTPFGFYRSGSGVRPETIKMEAGTLYPLANPKEDVVYPQLGTQDQTIALNLIAMVQQWSEKQSMQGALQMGGVPQGKASALRTSTNMQSVLQQGDARPERILRRFFLGMAEIYQQMHELNKVFLPPNKQYRISGVPHSGADPYRIIEKPEEIGGMFQFDFKANALNTSKAFKSQALSELLPVLVNGLAMQMGISNPETIYNLLKDLVESKGLDNHRYLNTPPGADIPKVTAQEAMGQMIQGVLPTGRPAEGGQIHLHALDQFAQDPRFASLIQTDPHFKTIFQAYKQQVQLQVQQEMMQAQQAQMFADAMGGGGGQGGPEGSVTPGADQMQPQGQGQVMDEGLPGAKGMMG